MLNLYQLQSFVTVISEGSMTGAADKLFLTQPAISQQIKNLEDELGVELLVRGVRQIRPSLQGEVLYDYAKKVLHLAQQAEVAVRAMGAELRGQIRIGTLNSLGVQLISPIVSRLLKHNPNLSIKIDYDLGENLIKAFRKGELDAVILPEVEKQFGTTLDAEKKFLLKEEMWLVGSGKETEMPAHITVAEMSKYPLIHFTKEYPHFTEMLEKAYQKAGLKMEPTFESTNVGTLKRVIESGLGWGFLPALAIKKQVKMGRLNRVHVKELQFEVEFFYYHKKGADKVVEVFYQALQGQERG
jgi:LysR family transcriptional regulator, transcriptional activator of the cysJI operon